MKKCTICSKEFVSPYSWTRTCSKHCSLLLKKTRRNIWVSSNREHYLEYKRDFYLKEKEVHKERVKRYRASEQGRKVRNLQEKRRLSRDPMFRAKKAIRKRLWEYKRRFGSISMTKSVGCSWEEFKLYIENKFYPCPSTGRPMTWDNYGRDGWEIDHVVPLCAASSVDDLVKLSHYTNLQPLWRRDNISKSIEDSRYKSDFTKIWKHNE